MLYSLRPDKLTLTASRAPARAFMYVIIIEPRHFVCPLIMAGLRVTLCLVAAAFVAEATLTESDLALLPQSEDHN